MGKVSLHFTPLCVSQALKSYSSRPENGKPFVSPTLPRPELSAGLVTTRLLEAVHDTSEQVIYPSVAQPAIQQGASVNGHRKLVEKHETPPETYPTRWGGTMTLEQIITDPQVRRSAFAKAGSLGLDVHDQEDCVQQGFIKLWQKLRDDPKLLADKGAVWAGIYVAYSGNARQFHRHHRHNQVFTDPAFDWQAADEYLPLGRPSEHKPTRALWTTEADETIDVNAFIHAMNQHYADNPKKLAALQAIIGSLSSKAAAQQLGMHEKNFAAGIGNQVRQEVQALLPDTLKDTQPETWEAKLARGEGVEHIAEIAQEVMHDPRLLLALYVVTTSVTKKAVAETFGYGLTCFGEDIRTVKQMIAAKYRHDQLHPE